MVFSLKRSTSTSDGAGAHFKPCCARIAEHATSASSFRIVRKEADTDDGDEDSDGIAELSNAFANLADALGSGKSAHGAVDRFSRVCFNGVGYILTGVEKDTNSVVVLSLTRSTSTSDEAGAVDRFCVCFNGVDRVLERVF